MRLAIAPSLPPDAHASLQPEEVTPISLEGLSKAKSEDSNLVRVAVSSISRFAMSSGETGCRVDLTVMEPEQPKIVPRSLEDFGRDPSQLPHVIIQATATALQRAGMAPMPENPKMILFLTMEEYKNLGTPLINDIIELNFFSQYPVGDLQGYPTDLVLLGSIISLKKVR